MSQAGRFEVGGNPALPNVQTITGNTDGAVGPTAGGNINIVGDNIFTSVVGDPATHTLAVLLVNTQFFSVQTVDDTVTPLASIPLTPNSAISMVCDVIGSQDNYAQVCSGVIQGAARRQAGGAILVDVPSIWNSADNFDTADFDITVSGNDIVLQVTGEDATTINWTASIRYNVIDI